jgi:hypothetical protein
MFDVFLIPQGEGCWAAFLGGTVLGTEIREPKGEVAAILLANGADPQAVLTISAGTEIIARDPLGWLCGRPVTCTDVDMVERD